MDQEQKRKGSPLVLVLIIIIVVLVVAGAVLLLGKFGRKEPDEAPIGDGSTPLIAYQEGVTAIDDASALEDALKKDKELADEGGIPITFVNDANSADGKNIEGYIGNPERAKYDIYLQIFADAELTDQLYLSGLIPPGSVLKNLELERTLPAGDHRVYVAVTQVEDDHATMHAQTYITLDFHVKNQ